MRITEINAPVLPDTYEASMFLKQAIRAGKYAIKIHNLLTNDQEMEAWVAKKIDLASSYVSSVAHYLEGQEYMEDAGEGHMSKSQLYATAKYAVQITSMVQPGDDIEGWVQTKMNRAVDMLDAVYHYEDYQRLNPYREALGDLHQRHAGIVQKNIDQILATETEIDDIETIPGMLNIMKRRVQEVEKKLSKEMREGSRMPSSMIQHKQKLDAMSPEEIRAFFKNREDFAAQHRGGKIAPGFSAKELAQRQEFSYGREFAKGRPYSKHFENTELDEGLKDWLQRMAVAGIIVGSVAGIGSINNAINNNVPAIQAINKALDTAQQKGDTQLAAQIQKDLQDAKLRLDTGKDLNQVKYLQDKYKNFMPTGYKSENKDDQDYPAHLQDLFKKLRDKQSQDKEIGFKVTDVTPKGYGPKDDAVTEYSPFKNKVLSKITKPSSDYADKLKTLDMIAKDPNTNKDPELKRELIRRKQELLTTQESSTVLYTNRLTDMMGKRLGEGWSDRYKKSINCSNPRGFSQRAHCQSRKK
jgi:predicted transcriptional regulator